MVLPLPVSTIVFYNLNNTCLPPYFLCFQVSCSGVFELQLESFKNTFGLNADENCCNGLKQGNTCSATCKTFFRICLKHYQQDISPDPPCTFGTLTTTVLGDNSFDFPTNLESFMNPIKLSFDFTWPVSYLLFTVIYVSGGILGQLYWEPSV